MNQAIKMQLECLPRGDARDAALALFEVVDAQDAFDALTQDEQENTLKPHAAFARVRQARAALAAVERRCSSTEANG